MDMPDLFGISEPEPQPQSQPKTPQQQGTPLATVSTPQQATSTPQLTPFEELTSPPSTTSTPTEAPFSKKRKPEETLESIKEPKKRKVDDSSEKQDDLFSKSFEDSFLSNLSAEETVSNFGNVSDTNVKEQEEPITLTPRQIQSLKMRELLDKMSPEMQERYEYFRRSSFPRKAIKTLMATTIGPNTKIDQTTAIVMAGIAKLYVGDLVETSREIMDEWKEEGPILPTHLREAYRRLKKQGKVPSYSNPPPKMFKFHHQ